MHLIQLKLNLKHSLVSLDDHDHHHHHFFFLLFLVIIYFFVVVDYFFIRLEFLLYHLMIDRIK
jgi:hypothetical protein